MDLIEYKTKVILLYSNSGYFDRFYEIIYTHHCRNYYEAYLILESEFLEIFGKNRYKSYQAFKNAKTKDTIRRQNKTKVTFSYC